MNDSLAGARVAARWIARATAICLTAGAIALLLYLWVGPPSPARLYRQDEVARFSPTAGHGIGQLAGETVLLTCIAVVGRRWFRIRL